jgi:hypothetical protein
MLEALKSCEINDASHFIGGEHPIHCCFQELSGNVSSYFSPDIVSTEFLHPLRIVFRVSIRVLLRYFSRDGIDFN